MKCQGYYRNWYKIRKMEFKDWITKKYLDWRGDAIGRDRSIKKFSDFIGVSQPLMSRWMNEKNNPSLENARKIADRFGNEVYDILDIPQDERPVRADLREAIRQVPPENQDELLELIEEFLRDHGWQRV